MLVPPETIRWMDIEISYIRLYVEQWCAVQDIDPFHGQQVLMPLNEPDDR